MNKILVIPTIRENNIKSFLKEWEGKGGWDKVIIIEDNPNLSFNIKEKNIECYSWDDIKSFTKNEGLFSKRDSAIRSFGFMIAYKQGADYIFTLDDDCLPSHSITEDNTFCDQHIKTINGFTKWSDSVLGMRTRGLPYRELGKLENVKLNMGLWENVPDLDAIQQLSNKESYFYPPTYNRVLPNGQYTPICGMNMCFTRDFTPLSYFALMGEGQEFNRFDDIWFGIISKKVCDYMGYYISIGNPIINHSRASNPFTNLIKESRGVKYNETFWCIVESISLKECSSINDCIYRIAHDFQQRKDNYLNKMGENLLEYCNLCTS